MAEWRLLSNHGRVLVFIAREPKARQRDIAEAVGLTERSVHRIVSELCDEGYLTRIPNGRTKNYEIHRDVAVHDPLLGDHQVGEILAVVADNPARPDAGAPRPDTGA